MHSWLFILLASVFVSACTVCAQLEPTPECNQMTYGLIMRRITQVTYHTHATVRDAYIKTKRYVDDYQHQNEEKHKSMDAKLNEIRTRLITIQTQLSVLTTGPVALSQTDIEKTGRLAGSSKTDMENAGKLSQSSLSDIENEGVQLPAGSAPTDLNVNPVKP